MNPQLIPAVLALLGLVSCATVPSASRESRIQEAFERTVSGHPDRTGAGLVVSSSPMGLNLALRASPDGPEAFHAASVGKLFTTVLIARLIDDGRLTLDTKVAPLLPPGTLDGLFVYKGNDHQSEVTVRHLLGHTSGAGDYFADPGVLARNPETLWTPEQILDLARTGEAAVGPPGQTFHYSDTGFVVLGLVVESLRGRPFHESLREEILVPLSMDRTWMPYRNEPTKGPQELRQAWLGGRDVSTMRGISLDWSGGGVATTEADLLTFQRALWSGTLVSPATWSQLQRFDHRFQPGIQYGLGVMRLRFGEFFFLLDHYPSMTGHMGILSTYLFYDPTRDLSIVATLGTDAAMEEGVRLIIDVLTVVLGG